MSVYIKDLEAPKSCGDCPFWHHCDCGVSIEVMVCQYDKRPDDCPLVPVPDHGRLIDADALMGDLPVEYPSIVYAIDDAPTIIPAEEAE